MGDNWRLIGNVSEVTDEMKALFDEAVAAVSPQVLTQNALKILPRNKIIGKCLLCGEIAELTREHIPPKKSGNKYRTISHDIDDWLKRQDLESVLFKGGTQQGGIYGYTLCVSCNSLTGKRYGVEYKKWAFAGFDALTKLPQKLEDLDKQLGAEGGWPWTLEAKIGSKDDFVYPGAFVRQVLSMFCSLSADWDLAGRYPEIRRIVLEQVAEPLPKGFDLGMGLYLGPELRFCGPQLRVSVDDGIWQWIMEIAYPPFSFLLVLCSNRTETLSSGIINDFVMWGSKEPAIYEADFGVGFGWTPYVADYRTSARIKQESEPG